MVPSPTKQPAANEPCLGTVSVLGCTFRTVKRRPNKPAVDPMLQQIFDAADAMTAGGQEARKHHVVPRFYLDRWAENNRVTVTDLDAHTSFNIDPAKALIENDFYRVPAGTVAGSDSPVVWEAWLSQVEGVAAAVFDKLDNFGARSLDGDDRGRLAGFVAVQITRSRWHRYQARWMNSVGIYRAMELDRPGAIEAQLRRSGENPTAARIAEVESYFAKVLADPWQMQLPATFELDLTQRSSIGIEHLLVKRQWYIYETTGALITGDEPVVSLWEHMGADHLQNGGYLGTPIVFFPLDPHHVLAMFRQNMPVYRSIGEPLDWRDTLDLNTTIAGNSYRHVVSQPSHRVASKLYVPPSKEPTKLMRAGKNANEELLRWRVTRRWSDERDAPVRTVKSWWPLVVPLPPRAPSSRAELDAEYKRWMSL